MIAEPCTTNHLPTELTDPRSLLKSTRLLDYEDARIARLIDERGWAGLAPYDRVGAAYAFVRDKIAFGYNIDDDLPASRVLADGYGQCNTKSTLLMALLRGLGISCRLHGFTIHKSLQRGVVPELIYRITPDNIIHSWVELSLDGGWVTLEGFILDRPYLTAIQAAADTCVGGLCGYGVGTEDIERPPVDWSGGDTYIQRTGINADLGLYPDPDAFYAEHAQAFGPMRRLLFRHLVRHWMNYRVGRIREGRLIPRLGNSVGEAGVFRTA